MFGFAFFPPCHSIGFWFLSALSVLFLPLLFLLHQATEATAAAVTATTTATSTLISMPLPTSTSTDQHQQPATQALKQPTSTATPQPKASSFLLYHLIGVLVFECTLRPPSSFSSLLLLLLHQQVTTRVKAATARTVITTTAAATTGQQQKKQQQQSHQQQQQWQSQQQQQQHQQPQASLFTVFWSRSAPEPRYLNAFGRSALPNTITYATFALSYWSGFRPRRDPVPAKSNANYSVLGQVCSRTSLFTGFWEVSAPKEYYLHNICTLILVWL